MQTNRLEAFSDGVLAIIITIMVLELKLPEGDQLASLGALLQVFIAYVVSFVYVGIYWNNHHHLLHSVDHIRGGVLWANLHLLFWLSLFPFATAWLGAHPQSPQPTALYGVVLLMAALAWSILQAVLIAGEGSQSRLALAVGRDWKGKGSAAVYALAIAASFVEVRVAQACYLLVALLWLVPDRRIERMLAASEPAH